jgi:ABC-type glutathione transport system ATPase component
MKEPLLRLTGITKTFHRGGEQVAAVVDVDLHVAPGESVALVGESGSGKSTLARIALGLMAPDKGSIFLEGRCLSEMKPAIFANARTAMQPIFQDPGQSFNPRRRVGEALAQALWRAPRLERRSRSLDLLNRVGLRPAEMFLDRYPHELSGGQKQRLAVARAVAMAPRLIVADEPLSGADVSIRGQMLNLLSELRKTGIAFLMITHDISVARAFADRVAVMHRGLIVESGPAAIVLDQPEHAYTRRLIESVPRIDRYFRTVETGKACGGRAVMPLDRMLAASPTTACQELKVGSTAQGGWTE